MITLGVGIGANAAIFSVFDQFLLRPLSVPQPGRLVNFSAPGPNPGFGTCGQVGDCHEIFSYPMFRDLEREQTAFSGIAAHMPFGALPHPVTPRAAKAFGSPGATSGARPGLRWAGCSTPTTIASPANPGRGAELRILAKHSAGSVDLNQTLIVNGQAMTVVGVVPGVTGTTLGVRPQVFVPITMDESMTAGRTDSTTGGVTGRICSGGSSRAYRSGKPRPVSTCHITRSSTTSKPRCRRA